MDQDVRNDQVRERIARLNAYPSNESRTDLDRQLTEGFLLLAVASIPQAIEMTGTPLPGGTSVTVLTTSMPEGDTAMLAFTDLESLQSRTTKTPYVVMQARDVLEMVIDEDYDALVLNPAGPWGTVPREDIVGILEEFGPAE
jgi:SseB protein N-terminal domain